MSASSSRIDTKRVFDVVVAGLGVVVLSPVLLLVAVAVKVESRGPVIFRQERVGRHGRTFRIHKFRSMRVGPPGPLVTPSDDPRVTRVGRILRRTKLDELPQLIDVLIGDMSIVGPRPEVPRYVELWDPGDRELILSVRPGITDPASVDLRHESERLAAAPEPETYYREVLLPEKCALYVGYVRDRSFFGDLRVLLQTAKAVLS